MEKTEPKLLTGSEFKVYLAVTKRLSRKEKSDSQYVIQQIAASTCMGTDEVRSCLHTMAEKGIEFSSDLSPPHYKKLLKTKSTVSDRWWNHRIGQIYLMINNRNGFVKIGWSKNPRFRERTLQSQEPEVNMLFTTAAPPSMEKNLHSVFASKRVRGEWFKLTPSDIAEAKRLSEQVVNCR